MIVIEDMILAPAQGAFFYDDQAAIRQGVEQDGFLYKGELKTPGFQSIRQPSAALGIGLVLSDGAIVWGDMVSVQYSGAAGRDPLFDQNKLTDYCKEHLRSRLVGKDAAGALAMCDEAFSEDAGIRVPLAVRYGASQALMRAEAHACRKGLVEVVTDAFNLPLPEKPVPIFAQSGDERRLNVDKMVLKRVDVLPHGLINSREKFGADGAAFLDYVSWVAQRVREIGDDPYQPTLHFDLYGWIGLGIGTKPKDVVDFICKAAEAASGFKLLIESPVDYASRDAQIENYAEMVELLDALGKPALLVADEHCNTLHDVRDFCAAKAAHMVQVKTPDIGDLFDTARAILHAKEHGIGAYCGGTCAETDLSARACVNIALATQADMMLAKPGMGVDEGISIVSNEQNRALATLERRQGEMAS